MYREVMTVSEVAAYLRIKEKTVYRLVAEGKLPGFKVGGSWRFMRDEIEQWIRGQYSKNRPEEN